MVHKINILIFTVITIILCIFGFIKNTEVETNLLKTLLPQKVINTTDIVPIANKSSSVIKVVFEADTPDDLETISEEFINIIDTNYFEIYKPDVAKLLDKYLTQPANFLSYNTKTLLKSKKYDEVYSNSIKNLYSPSGLQLSTLDNDPYLLLDDFIMSNKRISTGIDSIGDKYYDHLLLKISSNDALSPDVINKKIANLVSTQKELSNNNLKIYLGGTPVHSYHTSSKSMTDINIICILSTLMIIFLTFRYFRNLTLLIPVALSITFGMLSGYVATKLWFDSFQIITMVFSTTLIGIGIDYSYHYFFSDNINDKFLKNLSFSLITTIVPFVLLYCTGIELLKQVAVFTVFGLFGIYLAVLLIYPCFHLCSAQRIIRPKLGIYKFCLIFFCVLSILGIFRLHFDDSLTSLYSPSKELKKAEELYSKVSGYNNSNAQFITVKGNNITDIIKTEEAVVSQFADGTEYMALSKFIPSADMQKENFELVKNLYRNNLDKYSGILSQKQIRTLKNKTFTPVVFDINDFPYLKDFMLNSNTSIITVSTEQKLNIKNDNTEIINLQADITGYMKHYRKILICLFPVVLLLSYLLLTYLYNRRKAVILLTPSVTGIILALLITTLIYGELNLFSIITVYLILGFTIDYSIFRIGGEEKTESAVFVSCLTTTFSFLLLAFCGFKLLSSMAVMLFFGILISYISGYILFNRLGEKLNHENS